MTVNVIAIRMICEAKPAPLSMIEALNAAAAGATPYFCWKRIVAAMRPAAAGAATSMNGNENCSRNTGPYGNGVRQAPSMLNPPPGASPGPSRRRRSATTSSRRRAPGGSRSGAWPECRGRHRRLTDGDGTGKRRGAADQQPGQRPDLPAAGAVDRRAGQRAPPRPTGHRRAPPWPAPGGGRAVRSSASRG